MARLGKTENTEEHLCGDEHGVRKFWTIRRQPESARWRREYVDKLSGDPFNPKPKTSMAVGPGELPVDLQWGTRTSPNAAATQQRLYVTEALVNEHGPHDGLPALLERNRHTQRRVPCKDRRNPAATEPYEAG